MTGTPLDGFVISLLAASADSARRSWLHQVAVQNAIRGVVREAVKDSVAEVGKGLPDDEAAHVRSTLMEHELGLHARTLRVTTEAELNKALHAWMTELDRHIIDDGRGYLGLHDIEPEALAETLTRRISDGIRSNGRAGGTLKPVAEWLWRDQLDSQVGEIKRELSYLRQVVEPTPSPHGSGPGFTGRKQQWKRTDRSNARNRSEWVWAGPEGRGHFVRRGYGQRSGGKGGDLFRGRSAALATVEGWLRAESCPGEPLVVIGQPGSGKSTVVARAALNLVAAGVGPGVASHARDATHADVLAAIAKLTGHLPGIDRQSLLDALLQAPAGQPWPIVIDALDEAHSRADRAEIVRTVVDLAALPCVRVVVATRPLSAGDPFARGALLPALQVTGPDCTNLVNLDDDTYADRAGLVAFAGALLAQQGVQCPGPPGRAWQGYREDTAVTDRLAEYVADRAGHSFLVAALAAYRLSIERTVVDPHAAGFDPAAIPASVSEAVHKYLDMLPDQERNRLLGLLTALAYARGVGVSDEIWIRLATALGYPATLADLDQLRDSTAADYLLQTNTEDGEPVTRLFHQALAEDLLAPRSARRRSDERAILKKMLPGTATGWAVADTYVRAHAADHARAAERLDELLEDGHYLTVADLDRLLPLLPPRPSSRIAPTVAVLRQATAANDLPPERRSRLLALSAAHLGLPDLQQHLITPTATGLVPRWAHALGAAHQILVGHTGESVSVALGRAAERDVVVTGGTDSTVLVFDAVTCACIGELPEHPGGVNAVAIARLGRRDVIATGGADGILRLTDATNGEVIHELSDHTSEVHSVALGRVGDRDVVVSGGNGSVLVHDLDTGRLRHKIAAHDSAVQTVAIGRACGRDVIGSGGHDGIARLFDACSGRAVVDLAGHTEWVDTVSLGRVGDRDVALTSGGDASVRICDPITGQVLRSLDVAWAMTATLARIAGRDLIIAGGTDGLVVVYDADTGELVAELCGHTDAVVALAAGYVGGRNVVATGSLDAMVRLYEIAPALAVGAPVHGHRAKVHAVVVGRIGGQEAVISADENTLRIFDPSNGHPIGVPVDTVRSTMHLATGQIAGRQMIVCGGFGGALEVIDARTRQIVQDFSNDEWVCVMSLAIASVADRDVLVLGANDGTARVLDATTGAELCRIRATADEVVVGRTRGVDFVVTLHRNDSVQVYDVSNATLIRDLSDCLEQAWTMATGALRDEDDILALGCEDGTTVIVDPITGQVLQRLSGHSSAVTVVVVEQLDGRAAIVTGSLDGTVRVFDPETAACVVQDVVDRVNAVAVSATGDVFIASGNAVIGVAAQGWDKAVTSNAIT